jgi:chromosome segregation protein
MVKPSPFCLLDEIDAALDEDNVVRFAQMLKEFSSASQFIVITHNKKTMIYAETLLGVSMGDPDPGITKVISMKLKNGELDVTPETDAGAPLFEEEDVEVEEGRELPIGIDDPALVSEAELRPIRRYTYGSA